MTKDDSRHLLGIMSEWSLEASVLIVIFGLLDHILKAGDPHWLSAVKGLSFIVVGLLFFGLAAMFKLMEKSLE